MSFSRYSRTSRINLGNGMQLATAQGVAAIRQGVKTGQVSTFEYITSGNERLDIIAGKKYGNARLWWLIAAASGIGWNLQVPPGTRLLIPNNLNSVAGLVK